MLLLVGNVGYRLAVGIKKNPYGVGYSGYGRIEETRTCSCCQIEFIWKGTKDIYSQIPVCEQCTHHSFESDSDKLAAYTEHNPRLVAAVNRARDMARELKQNNQRLTNEITHRRRQTAAALESRDYYRSIVTDLESNHSLDNGRCACKNPSCDVAKTIQKHKERRDYY